MANEQASEDLDLGEEKAGKSKLIIIIAIVVVVLIGGGLAAFFLLGGDEDAAAEGEAAAEEQEVDEKGPVQYLDFKPPFVVNLPGKPSLLQIGVSIRVYSEPLAEFIRHNDPMIRHHLLNLLSTKDAKTLKSREAKEALQKEMLQTLNKVVKELEGPGEVDSVFFTSLVMQ